MHYLCFLFTILFSILALQVHAEKTEGDIEFKVQRFFCGRHAYLCFNKKFVLHDPDCSCKIKDYDAIDGYDHSFLD